MSNGQLSVYYSKIDNFTKKQLLKTKANPEVMNEYCDILVALIFYARLTWDIANAKGKGIELSFMGDDAERELVIVRKGLAKLARNLPQKLKLNLRKKGDNYYIVGTDYINAWFELRHSEWSDDRYVLVMKPI